MKLDVSKAYDTVTHEAIGDLFAGRQLPMFFRAAYWCERGGRRLTFRTTDNTIQFQVEPIQGMPQGSPESPMIYAAIIEDMTTEVEDILIAAALPAGVWMDGDQIAIEVGSGHDSRRTRTSPPT